MAVAVPESLPPFLTLETLERGVELVPIPAAHLVRHVDGWAVEAANSAFRAGLLDAFIDEGSGPEALAPRLDRFVQGDDTRLDFDWATAEGIESRHFRVTFARTSAAVRTRCAVTFLDHTSRLRTERSLRREMTTDSLTGLPNRVGFGDLVEAFRPAARAVVLVVDLQRFGRINACLGGLAGDELLITVARRLKGVLRARDTLARIGGGEFAILLEIDADRGEADHAARRIRRALSAPFRLTEYEIGIDCGVGVAFGADEAAEAADGVGGDAAELIRHAQFAAKRAKTSGGPEFYEMRAFTVAREQFGMETALRRAIEGERLTLQFQPVCDLTTGRLVCFEALARWRDEAGVDVSPARFIPVAEESGLIVPLGRWALQEAARALAGWDQAAGGDCGVGMAVNLSPIQLQRDRVERLVADALDETGLEGRRLKLELTESALVTDPARTAETLKALSALGTTLAMDDFGTGYSNLALLQALPIDFLKIDRSFVTDMLADRNKLAIVRAILSLAQALGKRTVAEGIETNETAQTLAALGCALGQGYFYARPLDPEAAWARIAADAASSAS